MLIIAQGSAATEVLNGNQRLGALVGAATFGLIDGVLSGPGFTCKRMCLVLDRAGKC
jgi:hypothetical protein